MTKYFKHAWNRTLQPFGGYRAIVVVALTSTAGFVLRYWQSGWYVMSGELKTWLVYGLQAPIAAAIFLYVYHLLCAPYRTQKERAEDAERKLEKAENKLSLQAASYDMSDEKLSKLTASLRDVDLPGGTLNVIHLTASEIAADAAYQFAEAIRNAGHQSAVLDRLVGTKQDPRAKGLSIYHGSTEQHRQKALEVAKAFDAIGRQVDFEVLNSLGDRLLLFVANPKSHGSQDGPAA